MVAGWLHGDEGRLERYDAALRMWVDGLAAETIGIADRADAESAQAANLQIKSRQWAAEKLHRARYGQTLKVERSVSVTADAGLVVSMGELLGRLARNERVIEQEPAESVASAETI